MSEGLPAWVRGAHALDTAIARVHGVYEMLRDEVLFAFVDPADRTDVSGLAYRHKRHLYTSGDGRFDAGLFDWERSALAAMGVGPGSKILLGGAGGGRELRALGELGCRVVAFEPDAGMVDAARRVASAFPALSVHQASYADLIGQIRAGSGPLMEFARDSNIVIFGWGSFTHITEDEEQLVLLSAVRRAASRAQVLVSFPIRAEGDVRRLGFGRRRVRSALHALGGHSAGPGLTFQRRGGFMYRFQPSEVRSLAERAGYRIGLIEHSPYGHAVLVPE